MPMAGLPVVQAPASDRDSWSPMLLALGVSMLLHAALATALWPASASVERRLPERAIPDHAIEVTLEEPTAPSDAVAGETSAATGDRRPSGSTDLAHAAPIVGPPDVAALEELPALSELQAPLAEPPSILPPEAAQPGIVEQAELTRPAPKPAEQAAAPTAPPAAARSPDLQPQPQAPPIQQPIRQAPPRAVAQQAPPQSPTADGKAGAASRSAATAPQSRDARAEEDYVLQVVRKLHSRFLVDSLGGGKPRGVVVARLTVSPSGGLVGISLVKESGSAGIDRSVIDTIRKAAPFPALPPSFAGDSFSFIVPINYAQEG